MIWLYVIIMSRTSFRVNPHSRVCLNVKELLARSRCHIWSLSDSNVIRTHDHLFSKGTLNHLAKLAKWLSCVVNTHLYSAFDCMLLSCHVRVSEWIHALEFAWMLRNSLLEAGANLRSSSDRNMIRTHKHLVRKRTHNHFAKLAKWLSYVVSTYLYGAFDCMLLSFHVQIRYHVTYEYVIVSRLYFIIMSVAWFVKNSLWINNASIRIK